MKITIVSLTFFLIFILALTALADGGRWKNYTVADGLASPDVTVIFQDRLGNIWFGTESGGVSRFDGENLRPFGKQYGLPGGSIRQILDDKQENIWFIIAGNEFPGQGNLLYRYDGSAFHRITERDGLPGGVLDAVLKDKIGNLWLAGSYGLIKYDGNKFQHFKDKEFQQFISNQGTINGRINTIFESQSGNIWLGGGSGFGHPRDPRETKGFPFVILYDGKFHYFPLDSYSNSPFSAINAISEDESDNLWFGGNSILLKYDGKSFEHFCIEQQQKTPEGSDIRNITGQVILTWKEPLGLNGQSLFMVNFALRFGPPRFSESEIENLIPKDDKDNDYRYQSRIVDLSIESIFKDSKGRLWFNNRGFISHWDGRELIHFVIPENWDDVKNHIQLGKDNLPNFYPGNLMFEDAQGNLWFRGDGIHRFNGKTFQTYTIDDGLGSNNISIILEGMDGRFWFGHDNGTTLFNPAPPIIQNFSMRTGLGNDSVHYIHEDKQGLIWFSVRGGLAKYNGKKFQYFPVRNMGDLSSSTPPRFPLDTNYSMSILEREGDNLWFIGRETNQIFSYKSGNFRRYSLWRDRARNINRSSAGFGFRFRRPGAMDRHILAVDSYGNLWLAVDDSLIRFDGRRFQTLKESGLKDELPTFTPGRPGDRMGMRSWITDIFIDGKRNIWFSSNGDGIKRYDGTKIETFTESDNVTEKNIRRIFEDKNKNLWFAGEKKLIRYNGKSFQSFPISDFPNPPVAIHHNNNGVISFIYPQAIAKYDGVKFEFSEQNNILGNKIVWMFTEDSVGNLWLATNQGVVKYDGQQLTTYGIDDGLLVNDVRYVREDSQGNLWCATWGGGVAFYNGENFQAITTKDGLVHNNVHRIFEDSQGNMWFATDGGVTEYLLRTDVLPQIKLTKVIADHIYTDFDERLQFSDKIRQLTFMYQGFVKQRVNLLYSYKLEGYDEDWSEPSSKKQVEYSNIKPGNYTFLVKAIREDSPYSNSPGVVRFTIDKPLWSQSQFYLPISISGIAIVALIFLGYRLTIQRKNTVALRIELEEKEEAEIQRVKNELNDAREMQMGLLPNNPPEIHHFELAGISIPAMEVGGDFYCYFSLDNDSIVFALADVSGKGLRGAMNAVMSYGLLHEVARIESKAKEIMTRLNTGLYPLLEETAFTALNLGVLSPKTRKLQYTNAGQPYPIIKRGEKLTKLEMGGLPLGIFADSDYDEQTIILEPGDYIIFYTDGINEAMNESEEVYEYERLVNIISKAAPNLNAEEMIQHILKDVRAFMGKAEQYDDMTIVVLHSLDTA